jgi:lysozyme
MPQWPGDNAVLALAMPLIKKFEGFSLTPYFDSAGIPTIGWGTILYPNGKPVTMADPPISEAYAQDCLGFEMESKCAALRHLLTVDCTLHQAAAMLSLIYNIGVANFTGSTVLHDFNAGNIQPAADAFLLWDKAHVNGALVVVPGLLNRRQAERTVFLTADT